MNSQQSRIYVVKANGQRVPFDHHKVEATCIRAGASKKLAHFVSNEVYRQIRSGMSTRKIYKLVLKALASDKHGQIVKQRYRLKESIMLMGPAGFHFENYTARILQDYGYEIRGLRAELDGKCVQHEVDIMAFSGGNNKRYMIECKYHNLPGIFTGLKESLYTHARFLDLDAHFDKEMLVCNTRVSKEVITYAKCVDQDVISWRYPSDNSLEKMIEEKYLYPLTILPLSEGELSAFSGNNIMVTKDVLTTDANQLSTRTGISSERIRKLQNLITQIAK
jgi:hypothetical protein